jgi:hypothetical protein
MNSRRFIDTVNSELTNSSDQFAVVSRHVSQMRVAKSGLFHQLQNGEWSVGCQELVQNKLLHLPLCFF